MISPAVLKRVLALPPALRRSFCSSSAALGQPQIYDIVTVGGGPAGLSFISALRSHPSTQGLKIALLDAQDLTTPRGMTDPSLYSNRCSSLTPASAHFLRRIGVWERLDQERVQPYWGMDVWDGVSGSKVRFDSLDGQGSGLVEAVADILPGSGLQARRRKYDEGQDNNVVATMCENNNLTSGLLRLLEDQTTADNGLEVLDKTKVDSIELGPEPDDEEGIDLSQWPVVHTNRGSLAARLLVGADGANSPVRAFAGIPSPGWDYNQHGVVATLTLDQSFSVGDPRTAYQRFLPTGPIALLPLPQNKASLVWSTTPEHAAKLKSLPPEDFVAMVNAAFRLMPVDIDYMVTSMPAGSRASELSWRESATLPGSTGLPPSLPRVTAVQDKTVASFPLRLRHADTYTGHRVALLGDAAHTTHPLAGQGLNLGLADAEVLAEQVAHGIEHGMDIGSSWCLDGYNAERWAANHAMLGVVDKLQKVYSVRSGPVVWGRSLGLEVVERLGPIKSLLMGAAAGTR